MRQGGWLLRKKIKDPKESEKSCLQRRVTHLFALKFTSYGKNTEKGAMCKILLCGEVIIRRQRNGGSTLLSEELGNVTSVGVL